MDNSNRNTFQYIDLSDISSTAIADTEEIAESYGVFLKDSPQNTFRYNVITDAETGIRIASGSLGTTIYYNSITGTGGDGLKNATSETVDATLNWWGSAEGPSWYESGEEEKPEYNGGGEEVVGDVSISPWLKADPDADPTKPGIQLTSPFSILVKQVGPMPTTENGNTGYLDMALWGASNVSQKAKIEVAHGTYQAREPLDNVAELVSEKGSTCKTCLENLDGSEVKVEEEEVTIGKLDGYSPRGFIIKDEVVVESGVDASSIQLNWNDLRKGVENRGDGRLDAEYNWWGGLDPSDSVVGDVDYKPFLPEEPCSFTDYMKKHDLKSPRAAVVNKMSEGETCSTDLPKRMIVKYRLRPREAEELVDEYGCFDVRRAMEEAEGNLESLKDNLGISKI